MTYFPANARKSTFTDGVQCVEVGHKGDRVFLRDDENPDDVVNMSRGSFDAFAKGVEAGQFNDCR